MLTRQVLNRVLRVFQEFSSSNRESNVVGVLEECDSFLRCILSVSFVNPTEEYELLHLSPIDFKYPLTNKVCYSLGREHGRGIKGITAHSPECKGGPNCMERMRQSELKNIMLCVTSYFIQS